jgi:hypothetical protein
VVRRVLPEAVASPALRAAVESPELPEWAEFLAPQAWRALRVRREPVVATGVQSMRDPTESGGANLAQVAVT